MAQYYEKIEKKLPSMMLLTDDIPAKFGYSEFVFRPISIPLSDQPETNLFTGLSYAAQVEVIRSACGRYNDSNYGCKQTNGYFCHYDKSGVAAGNSSINECPYVQGLKEPLKWELTMEAKRGKDPLILYPNLDGKGVNFDDKKIKITVTEVKENK
jgi:hypothetical protein